MIVLCTWEDQLKRSVIRKTSSPITYSVRHLHPGSMRWHVFHSNKRKLDLRKVSSFEIILTTYDVVVSEYRKAMKSVDDFSIFSILWRRIILDEGRKSSDAQEQVIC